MLAKIANRMTIAVFLMALLACAAVFSQQASATVIPRAHMPRAQKHEYRHEIEQAEERWREAMIQRNPSVLENLLAEDYTGITPNGAIQTRDQVIGNMRSGAFQVTALFLSDRKIRFYGSTAVVTSLADITASKDTLELSGHYRYTRVYVRNESGQWKVVSFEASRIQDTGEHK